MASHVDFVGLLFIVWRFDRAHRPFHAGTRHRRLLAHDVSGATAGGGQFALGLTAAAFTTLALIGDFWGVAHITVGVPCSAPEVVGEAAGVDARLRRSGAAAVGTALGIYALWVLLTEEGKRTFQIAD